ncbi:MAG: hypothetical protein M1821_003198 [Bathelium mastoideum]|nr:MAG: hypothetical protein M1821_003198 [Bathelium mastoideum]KAI9689446.1 MAG: hypothetical protein M1822_010097 [Bathelium mastoideum]
MKAATGVALLAGLLSFADAINLVKRENPAVINAPIERKRAPNTLTRDRLRRRQSSKTVSENLDNDLTLYYANISLGTPEQQLRLHIDTGSSDLWTNVATSQICEAQGDQCGPSGTFDASSSSSWKFLNNNFNISYVDGSGSAGAYGTDTLRIGGVTLPGLQIGLGNTSTSSEGILGIGYEVNEVAVNRANAQPYANTPALMVQQGLINTNAYSLWLNDLNANTGNILFGGVDTDQYHGSLETVPIVQEDNTYAEFIIVLTAVGNKGTAATLASNQDIPVLLDSGSSLSYLPNDVTQTIYNHYNADYDESQGAAFVDCNLANSDDSLVFTFSSPSISVGLSELVILAGYDQNNNPECILGIGPADDSTPVLGDTFLRSAYVVYDLHNNEISLAQTNFNATTTNVMEITNSSVPDATLVPSAMSTANVGAGGARTGGVPHITDGPNAQGAAPAVQTGSVLTIVGIVSACFLLGALAV